MTCHSNFSCAKNITFLILFVLIASGGQVALASDENSLAAYGLPTQAVKPTVSEAVDLNGDHKMEVVSLIFNYNFPKDVYVNILENDQLAFVSVASLIPAGSEIEMKGVPAFFDLNGDGRKEMIGEFLVTNSFGQTDHRVLVFEYQNHQVSLASFWPMYGYILNNAAIVAETSPLICFKRPPVPPQNPGQGSGGGGLGQFPGDGSSQNPFGTAVGGQALRLSPSSPQVPTPPEAFVVLRSNEKIFALDAQGMLRPNFPIMTSQFALPKVWEKNLVCGDLDGDGADDLFFTYDVPHTPTAFGQPLWFGYFSVIDFTTLQPLPGFASVSLPPNVQQMTVQLPGVGGAGMADIAGGPGLELVLDIGYNGTHGIFAFDALGNGVSGFPSSQFSSFQNAHQIVWDPFIDLSDIDGDGKSEIFLQGTATNPGASPTVFSRYYLLLDGSGNIRSGWPFALPVPNQPVPGAYFPRGIQFVSLGLGLLHEKTGVLELKSYAGTDYSSALFFLQKNGNVMATLDLPSYQNPSVTQFLSATPIWTDMVGDGDLDLINHLSAVVSGIGQLDVYGVMDSSVVYDQNRWSRNLANELNRAAMVE